MAATTAICCSACGLEYHVPTIWQQSRRNDHATFWCPNGHSQHYPGASPLERVERERNIARQQVARAEDQAERMRVEALEQRERAMAAEKLAKGRLTRLQKVGERVHKGLCPHCNRSFTALHRHMATKHPGGPKLVAEAV